MRSKQRNGSLRVAVQARCAMASARFSLRTTDTAYAARGRRSARLAINRQIVERLGGSLSFAPSKAGAGCMVRLNQ